MTGMLKKYKNYTIAISILIALSVGSYAYFLKYEPKILDKLKEVKGASTSQVFAVPYPKAAEKIGFNQTSNLQQTTFQTSKNPQEVTAFYKGVFKDKGWELDSETADNTKEIIVKFKKENERTTVISTNTDDSDFTIVSIEIVKL